MFPAFHINIIRYIETDSDLVFGILYTVTYVDLDTVTSTFIFFFVATSTVISISSDIDSDILFDFDIHS